MPKLKPSEEQKDRERMHRNLKALQNIKDSTSADMGKIINRSHTTWDNRLKNPDSLTWCEIRKLCEKYNVDGVKFCFGELVQLK